MIVTAPILMATGVASNSILVTLAPLCLALGLIWAFEESLPTSVALKANSLSHANGDIFRNAPPSSKSQLFFDNIPGQKNNHRIQIYQELIQDTPAYIS